LRCSHRSRIRRLESEAFRRSPNRAWTELALTFAVALTLQRNRLSAAARFRRGGNDLRAFHSLWVGKAGGELLPPSIASGARQAADSDIDQHEDRSVEREQRGIDVEQRCRVEAASKAREARRERPNEYLITVGILPKRRQRVEVTARGICRSPIINDICSTTNSVAYSGEIQTWNSRCITASVSVHTNYGMPADGWMAKRSNTGLQQSVTCWSK
jgi:hypothetical protein